MTLNTDGELFPDKNVIVEDCLSRLARIKSQTIIQGRQIIDAHYFLQKL